MVLGALSWPPWLQGLQQGQGGYPAVVRAPGQEQVCRLLSALGLGPSSLGNMGCWSAGARRELKPCRPHRLGCMLGTRRRPQM